MFQSTYLYKVRRLIVSVSIHLILFQSTYLYKVRPVVLVLPTFVLGFNPRTYIRYDMNMSISLRRRCLFQSTYLYKVRPPNIRRAYPKQMFQSTYLYKVRQSLRRIKRDHRRFNPRTYIRYDQLEALYRNYKHSFNPRTYIRYDCITNNANIYSLLSMHLCDNKLFGFFIDEIKLIGVFNRLIINDCENSSFLLMLNVRKQLYYKFIFYIIGCDDTYVFNSFRIIISQEIETNTIFFMIDDIR